MKMESDFNIVTIVGHVQEIDVVMHDVARITLEVRNKIHSILVVVEASGVIGKIAVDFLCQGTKVIIEGELNQSDNYTIEPILVIKAKTIKILGQIKGG